MTITLHKADGLLDEIHGANAALDVAEAVQASDQPTAAGQSEPMTPEGMEMVFHAPLNF